MFDFATLPFFKIFLPTGLLIFHCPIPPISGEEKPRDNLDKSYRGAPVARRPLELGLPDSLRLAVTHRLPLSLSPFGIRPAKNRVHLLAGDIE